MRKGFGIDFGTTNSAIACAREGQGVQTTDIFRSVLYFEGKKPALSGAEAIDAYLLADEKGRLIQSLKSFLASRIFTGTNIFGKQYSVEDLIAIILRGLKETAERQFGKLEGPIVVGRPVQYANANKPEDNEFALARLKLALKKAGIGRAIFEFEPVAAAYYYESTLDHDELLIIGDFGGGTSDFSLLQVGPSGRAILGTEGVALAGDAFDSRIVRNRVSNYLGRESEYRSLDKILPMPEWIYSDLERWHYLSFLKSNETISMLQSIRLHSLAPDKISALLHLVKNDLGFDLHRAVQAAKIDLSTEESTRFEYRDNVLALEGRITRALFETWIADDLRRIRACIDRLLSKASVTAADIDHIFITGGSSLVPAVRRIFHERFDSGKISSGAEFTSVAHGLALRAMEEG